MKKGSCKELFLYCLFSTTFLVGFHRILLAENFICRRKLGMFVYLLMSLMHGKTATFLGCTSKKKMRKYSFILICFRIRPIVYFVAYPLLCHIRSTLYYEIRDQRGKWLMNCACTKVEGVGLQTYIHRERADYMQIWNGKHTHIHASHMRQMTSTYLFIILVSARNGSSIYNFLLVVQRCLEWSFELETVKENK